jgi:hypothetical protein
MTAVRTTGRIAGAAALVWLPAGVLLTTWAAWSGRLPGRIATHWGASGRPDGFTGTTAFWASLLVVATVAALAGVAALWPGRRTTDRPAPTPAGAAAPRPGRRTTDRWALTAAGAVAGGAAGIWLTTATAALAGGTAEARLGWRFLWFLAGPAWGAVVWAVAGRTGDAGGAGAAATVTEPMALRPGERAGFTATLRLPMVLGVTAAAAVLVAPLAVTVAPALWPVLAVPVLGGLMLGQVRVTADRRGLRLTAGVLGVPVRRIPLADIVAATAAHIEPMTWGGWGYQVLPGRSALVLRAGPGLVLDLRDGRRFAVTLDDPRTPAALLTALRERTGR